MNIKQVYIAPTVCVKKPDGTLRVKIDFWMVNKLHQQWFRPITYGNNQIVAISGATVFSKLDLLKNITR